MAHIVPRSHPREDIQVPIQYALLNTDNFEPAYTFDYSPEGMSYETRQKLDPDTEVCIVMDNYAPGQNGPEAYRSYVARIRWIHPRSSNGSKRYVAGAKIMARSHIVLATEENLPSLSCDLCGDLKPIHRIDQTTAGAHLCCNCLKHFSNISSKKIRQCVERFLVGNVV